MFALLSIFNSDKWEAYFQLKKKEKYVCFIVNFETLTSKLHIQFTDFSTFQNYEDIPIFNDMLK